MGKEERIIRISVRGLVEFLLRSGSLDQGAGAVSEAAMLEGARIHRRLQKQEGEGYRAEVPLRMEIDLESFSPMPEGGDSAAEPVSGGVGMDRDLIRSMPADDFGKGTVLLEGRADGIYCADGIREPELPEGLRVIDEIKTVFGRMAGLREPEEVHLAQARCYAWIYACRQGLDRIGIRLTYCSQVTGEVRYFYEVRTASSLETWFSELMRAYLPWAHLRLAFAAQRQETLVQLEFPFAYREGQRALAAGVYRTIARGRKLFLQAPTGTGKTMAVLFPALKALGEGEADRIWYLTAKAMTGRAAVEALTILQRKGLRVRSVVLAAKERICPCKEADCRASVCPRADGHYDRVNAALWDLMEASAEGGPMTTEVIRACAEKHSVCPYELAMDAAGFADVIVGDYNYVFSPQARLDRFLDGTKPVLLVDEAHNLLDRGRDLYSARLSYAEVRRFRRLVRLQYPRLWKKTGELVRVLRELDRQTAEEEATLPGLHVLREWEESSVKNTVDAVFSAQEVCVEAPQTSAGPHRRNHRHEKLVFHVADISLGAPLTSDMSGRVKLLHALETVQSEIRWILEQEERGHVLYGTLPPAADADDAADAADITEAAGRSGAEEKTRTEDLPESFGSGTDGDSLSRREMQEFLFSILHFQQTLEHVDGYYIVYTTGHGAGSSRKKGFVLHLYCADPSGRIRECMEKTAAGVFFSATFLPIQYYKGLLGGLPEDYEMYARSSFSPAQLQVTISADVTSRYRDRNEENYRRIADRIGRIIGSRAGNYMVFFPSYAFLDNVCEAFRDLCGKSESKETQEPGEAGRMVFDRTPYSGLPVLLLTQTPKMEDPERAAFLEAFEETGTDRHLVGFCVLGGMFGEGIDLRADRLIGSLIVGTGIPPVEPERELLRAYFSGQGKNGYDYAYRFPGMNKVLQAAGRVIRTEEDRGIVVLLDDRFADRANRSLFPLEWESPPAAEGEAVVSRIRSFWDRIPAACDPAEGTGAE